jgi:hypothetical protein
MYATTPLSQGGIFILQLREIAAPEPDTLRAASVVDAQFNLLHHLGMPFCDNKPMYVQHVA